MVQLLFLLESLHTLWILGLPEEMCIIGMLVGEISKTIVHVRNGLVAHTSFYPVPERCEFANFRELTGWTWYKVLKTFSQSFSRCSFCPWSAYRRVHSANFVRSFPFSPAALDRTLHTSLRLLLSWFTEWMIRNQSSVRSIRIEVYRFFSFQLSQDSTTQGTGPCEDWVPCFLESLHPLWSDGISFSLRFVVAICMPLLLVSKAEERLMSLRESLRVRLAFFWIWNTNLSVSFSCPFDVVEHCHDDKSISKFFRFNVPFLHSGSSA